MSGVRLTFPAPYSVGPTRIATWILRRCRLIIISTTDYFFFFYCIIDITLIFSHTIFLKAAKLLWMAWLLSQSRRLSSTGETF